MRPFEQTAEWWSETVPDGRTHAECCPWELAEVLRDVSANGYSRRRSRGKELYGDAVHFPELPSGAAAKLSLHSTPDGDMETAAAKRKEPKPEPLPVSEQVAHDRAMQLKDEELRELRRKYKAVCRDENVYDKLLDEGRAVLAPITPLVPAPRPVKPRPVSQSLVLNFADWHIDETVDAAIMEGLNWYDPPTALRRVECMVDKTLMIAQLSDRITYRTLYVHDLGDNCTNGIHEDAKATNSMSPLKGARFAATLKAHAIRDLAPHFERVVFRGVPGNHGRFTKGMPWKQPTENLDWLVYHWTALMCADMPNVTFTIPEAWSLTAEVEGWGFFLNHGTSDAKGGFGGISWYSLVKSDTKRTALDVKLERRVLVRQYGHMHQMADVERAGGNGRIRIEPSLKGGDEFPKEGMSGTYSEPAQSLLEVHAEEGLVAERSLNIRQYELNETCRYDSLLELL